MEELNLETGWQKPKIDLSDPATLDFKALVTWGLQENQDEHIPCHSPVHRFILTTALAHAKALVTGGVLLMSEETYGDLLCLELGYFQPLNLNHELYEALPNRVAGTIFNALVYVSDEIPADKLIALGREKAVVSVSRWQWGSFQGS